MNPKEEDRKRFDLIFVVVSYNSARFIGKCISSILPRLRGNEAVVVVDNGSTDSTLDILARLQFGERRLYVLAQGKNLGFGPANNVAFSQFNANFYFLVNVDAWFVGRTVEQVRKFLVASRTDNAGVIGFPLVYPDGTPQSFFYNFSSWQKWLAQILNLQKFYLLICSFGVVRKIFSRIKFSETFAESHSRPAIDLDNFEFEDSKNGTSFSQCDWVCGAAMGITDKCLKNIGGFDPKIFLYGEDEDLCISAKERGFEVGWLNCDPLVHHFGWGENQNNFHIAGIKYNSLRYFIEKRFRKRTFSRILMRIFLPLHVFGFVSGIRYAFKKRAN